MHLPQATYVHRPTQLTLKLFWKCPAEAIAAKKIVGRVKAAMRDSTIQGQQVILACSWDACFSQSRCILPVHPENGYYQNIMATSVRSKTDLGAQQASPCAELGFVAEQLRYSRMYFQLFHAIMIVRLWLWRTPGRSRGRGLHLANSVNSAVCKFVDLCGRFEFYHQLTAFMMSSILWGLLRCFTVFAVKP